MAAPFKNVVYHNFRQMSSKIASRLFSDSSNSNRVLVNKQKSLHLIGINRPEKRNSIDDETASQLRKAFEDFENDPEAYAAVLYGKGGNFCAGYDLSEVAKGNLNGISSVHGPLWQR
jgi:enoyl-CoA hydratase/carnithine racemase